MPGDHRQLGMCSISVACRDGSSISDRWSRLSVPASLDKEEQRREGVDSPQIVALAILGRPKGNRGNDIVNRPGIAIENSIRRVESTNESLAQ
jgi:hypothetical protein